MAELNGRILAGKVLVKKQQKEEETRGGIIIPITAETKTLRGEVVLVGKSMVKAEMEVAVGDSVYYCEKYGIEEIRIEGVDYFLMDQENILYIL
ncbi:co-chaperone GroES [Ancylomarina euxinus]|uniref:10 kDa chaperonin n=1 Tax=Ancylomarina euxinus TaxID=2283627 RepID=A0A425Y1J8_9BACT|nr:co-chaperone GroES [Ancylomarina euxinus]MCZ4693729.1 co-chaperone GroES [Ancylomarina euxinus]MUP15191.1 co-chaperone GroES [Ancylomarina euxinus]RRG21613.1 co-chaperone GroES [Ancylomarina euxinus]